jgi:hypothetical protein
MAVLVAQAVHGVTTDIVVVMVATLQVDSGITILVVDSLEDMSQVIPTSLGRTQAHALDWWVNTSLLKEMKQHDNH